MVLDSDVYEICEDRYLVQQHRGGPINPIKYMNFRAFSKAVDTPWINDNISFVGRRRLEANPALVTPRNGSYFHRGPKHLKPFRFVYYTEMDQIVRFDSVETFKAISAASNSSCFFTGRRKEKERDSDAMDYMGSLSQWRECGEAGYSMNWPADIHVRATKLPE